ncbi:hypothetical protein EV359DRAFT_86361 [Lentinula novae-zelandiae]|nr:hypothetical protein EV359DRAFT_86361 [Lentinula novae-zelandiae]
MQYLGPTTLLSCQNLSKCSDFCGMFSNEDGSTDAITALTTCSICGCKAASHIHMKAPKKETNTPPTASSKTPSPIFPSGSATTKTMSNSRSAISSFTACPFHDHLKTRKERTEGTESAKDGASLLFSSTSKSRFDPADAKRKSEFDDITGRPKKKKKESTSLKTARPSMPKPRVSASKAIIFNIGLYGAVSRTDAGTAKKPSPQEWQRMQMKNFIREISFPEDASTDVIATSIGNLFEDYLPPRSADCSLQFRVLQCIKQGGQGSETLLCPMNIHGKLNIIMLLLATPFTRPSGILSKVAPNFFYISPPPGCMNIVEFEDVLKDVGRQAKSESPSEPSSPPVADPEVSSDTEEVKFFWTPEGTTHFQYTGFGITTTSIITAFRQYKSRSLPDVHFARIIDILSEDVLDHMKDFFDLSQCILEETWGSEQRNLFDLVFLLGPGGIDLVVKFLKTLFEEVEASGQTFITKFYNKALQVFTQLRELPTCLVHLVRHFCSVTWRALWDPKDGFSQFSIMLKRYGGSLPPGRSNSIFIHDLTAIKLYSSSAPDIAASLNNKAFGHITDPTKIYPRALCSGKYGLHYFFDHLVETVLDVLEVGGRHYSKILKLFESLCGALADRLKAQITGSSWTRSSPAPSTSTSFTPSFTNHSSDQSSSVSPRHHHLEKKQPHL